MKFFALAIISLNILLINSQKLRNLLLTMTPEKQQILTEAATKAIKYLFNLDMNFNGNVYGKLEDKKHKIEVALYDDQEIPTVVESFRYEISNYSPKLPKMNMTLPKKLTVGSDSFDLEEKYKIMANQIASSYKNGFSIYYLKKGEGIVSSCRYKCYVNGDDGESIGSFEISLMDKNDYEKLEQAFKDWYNANKNNTFVKTIEPVIAAGLSLYGIVKDIGKKSGNLSSFLKLHSLALLLIFGLF